MTESIQVLALTAITIAFTHTLMGPDHYLPFIVLSEARKWSTRKTMLLTFLCGLGHVLSSVIIGFVGIGIGVAVNKLVGIESARGSIAAWLFIAFGLVYTTISICRLARGKHHTHSHFHAGGVVHSHNHNHNHNTEHSHIHEEDSKPITPWVLFLIFVFGPCEPLIPILMYPAAENNIGGCILVTALFSIVTIATMMTIVYAFKKGFAKINLKPIEKYANVIAGAIILFSGLSMQFLGL